MPRIARHLHRIDSSQFRREEASDSDDESDEESSVGTIDAARMLLICAKSILPLVCTAVELISGFVETPAPLHFSPSPLDLGTRGMIFDA